ncbi:exopolysaccharide biosynthesis polyprenyl glycosylphosphotransferase [Bradyrhizobium australiense]|uniref:Exopolysaccharide biosynthesis polyprenyl glycosylphosphotransferase n=1 Tax=Bradyrhizobium australiense TaxID=2721161 RepID=A0A7Y4GWS9_9BRAD|nr:exopolysaccharide biosynthesis polyprenyl glycosylphosphotransferase [Bradyrhizobium australiense]NOJ43316.1 exopolysaccharide biosynthesis polyprenyl glycosylphosphotransferase [Bradyrhizobium australiense]
MAEVGAILPRSDAPKSWHRGWHRGEAGFADRFRKPLVAATLASGDVVAAIAATSLSRALIGMTGMQPAGPKHLLIALLILMFFCVRLYTGCGPSPYERFRLRAIGIMGFVAIEFLVGFPNRQSGLVLVTGLSDALFLLMFGHYFEAMIRTLLIHLDLWGASVALVGCGDKSRELAQLLVHQPTLGLRPIGFVETPRDRDLRNTAFPLPLIGAITDLGRMSPHVEFAIFSSAEELSALTSPSQARISSCRFLLVEDLQDLQSLWLRTRMLGGAIGIEIRRDLCLRHNQVLKRAIDILFAIPIALLVLPIILVLVFAIKLVDPGSAIYVQERVGRNSKALRILKLRTMYNDAEQRLEEHLCRDPQASAEWQRFFKLSHDPRVLPIIGSFMRRTSLDELPQLWNVIRGDMSLVGPRPFPAYHMNSFDYEFRIIRVSVPPGITGMWQVSSRSNGDLQVQKAQDLFYIRNWSIWLDIYILLQTMIVVLNGRGAK